MKSNPFRTTFSESDNKSADVVVTYDRNSNSSSVSKEETQIQVDGFLYTNDKDLRTSLALKIANQLKLNTTASLTKINSSSWSPKETDYYSWSSPAYDSGFDSRIRRGSDIIGIQLPTELSLNTIKYASSVKLNSKGTTKTYNWAWPKNKNLTAGKITMVVDKDLIIQTTIYLFEKNKYKLLLRSKLESTNYPVSAPKGPFLEYDQILADPEFSAELYSTTAKKAFTSIWISVLTQATEHSLLNQGQTVTIDDIGSVVTTYDDQLHKFFQYSQAIETSFRTVTGELMYACSTLPLDVPLSELYNTAEGDPEKIPFSLTFQRCVDLGYTVNSVVKI